MKAGRGPVHPGLFPKETIMRKGFMDRASEILVAEGVTKRFGGLVALDEVHLQIRRGEVHALVGENGAGKSTMMNIIGGVIRRDEGSIRFEGKEVDFATPMEAIDSGIAVIHQELSMMPDLNIIENVYMGRMETHYGRIMWDVMAKKTAQQLSRLGLTIDPYKKINRLTTSHRQMVEIAKAISTNAQLIVMDEPNSSLTESESERLFTVIDNLQKEGISIIYVSHKLDEVLRIADRITTFRDGQYVGTLERSEASVKKIIRMMVGRDVEVCSYPAGKTGDPVLQVRGLNGQMFQDITFSLKRGEILGFSGLVGAGRSELARALFGADPVMSGEVILEGRPVSFSSPQKAISAGLAMLAEDRKTQSIFPNLPIWMNLSISRLSQMSRYGVVDWKKVARIVNEYTAKFSIKMGNNQHPISSLSGGNQQKVILARWLAVNPQILILDEPTHGVDVGAKADIYTFIHQLAAEGLGIIFISSEMPELMALCHRIIVMHEGSITGVLSRDEFSEERIMTLAAGYAEQTV